VSKKEYYNLIRSKPFNEYKYDSLEGLLCVLEEEGFKFYYKMEDRFDESSKLVSQVLQQLFFISED